MLVALLTSLLLVSSGAATPAGRPASGVRQLGEGVRAFRAGDYPLAIAALRAAHAAKVRNDDYARFYLAEALAASETPAQALALYRALGSERKSRFASQAQWKVADLLWQQQERQQAVVLYRHLLSHNVADGERARAWMRVGEQALLLKNTAEASTAFETVMVQFATHPSAPQAEAQLKALRPAGSSTTGAGTLSPRLRIERARRLSDKHLWFQAIADLEPLQEGLSPDLKALRDFVAGQAKYRARSDYAGASRLLYGAVSQLPQKEAVWAAFHGARALSRADKDDEAIEGYLKFVAAYPNDKLAPEAQFLAGWLAFNQGRFAKAIPALTETLQRFGRTTFAVDAAWYLAMGSYFMDDLPGALTRLADFERRAKGSAKSRMWPQDRVNYWRARVLFRLNQHSEAIALYQALAREQPMRWYGLLATARLREQNLPDPMDLHDGRVALAELDAKALRDPALLRVDELLSANLPSDAGYEIERAGLGLMKRLGRQQGLMAVITRSNQAGVWAKSYRLADIYGSDGLALKPQGDARLLWQAVYPLAYPDLVKTYGPPAGNPEHYLHAIMQKESGYDPQVVSYADARGLLQMIPPTSRKVAAMLGVTYVDDDLFVPAINVRLGASYIGALYKKFRQQLPLSAGAYNAGPGAMMRWLDRHGKHPMDEFVELVPYEQTREYMKRVAGIYARYRYLYAQERYLPSLTVDAHYLKDEPNY